MPPKRSNVVGMIEIPRDAKLYDQTARSAIEKQLDTRRTRTPDDCFTPPDRLQPAGSSRVVVEANLSRLQGELAVELQTFLDRLRIAS